MSIRHAVCGLPLIFCVFVICRPICGGEDAWAFLKDGRVGKIVGQAANGETEVRFADGNSVFVVADLLAQTKTATAVADEVKRLQALFVRSGSSAELTQAGNFLQAAAVPALLTYLRKKSLRNQFFALCMLQMCWSPEAREDVVGQLTNANGDLRRLALVVLQRNVKPDAELAKLLEPLLASKNATIVREIFQALGEISPDPARMEKFLADKQNWPYLREQLPRYYSPKLTPGTRKLLGSSDEKDVRAAIVGLIHQSARDPDTRKAMGGLLNHRVAEVRELAAEYFTWHGIESELKMLDGRAAAETDRFARAAMAAAGDLIRKRATMKLPVREVIPNSEVADTLSLDNPYPVALNKLLKGELSGEDAFKICAEKESFEPVWKYGITPYNPQFELIRQARLCLQATLLGLQSQFAEAYDFGKAELPTTAMLSPPVRGFTDPGRKSYGIYTGKGTGPFSDSYHVGDDVAWRQDHAAVLAIGDGVVQVAYCGKSWGGIIIVEHQLADGKKCCSLYAHLSPLLLVKGGERVKLGQKIGSVGRSYTWENGGYMTHMHFGIHTGAFLVEYAPGDSYPVNTRQGLQTGVVKEVQPQFLIVTLSATNQQVSISRSSWITGYLSPGVFQSGKHLWVKPQEFLAKYAATAAFPVKPGTVSD